jgi:hypothetical protein
MNVDSNLAYEIAKKILLEKESKILELTIMYNQALKEIEVLKQQLVNKGE